MTWDQKPRLDFNPGVCGYMVSTLATRKNKTSLTAGIKAN